MAQTGAERTGASPAHKADNSPQSALSSTPSTVIMAVTVLLCLAALWNWRAFGIGEAAWLLAFLLTIAIRAPHSKRNAQNAIAASAATVRELAVFPLLLTVMVLPLAQLAGRLPSGLNYRLPDGLVYAGMALQLPYLWLFHRSHADLVRNWSPGLEIRQGHELVTAGVYRRIRHPMYAAVAISAAAQPLLLQNWLAGPPAILAALLFLALRVPAEERMMEAHFAESYQAYRSATGHFLPRLRKGGLP